MRKCNIQVQVFFLFFFNIICFAQVSAGHQDSILAELKKIKENNKLLKTKDSIRTSILKDELDNIINPKSKELEKYKSELKRIRTNDSLGIAVQKEKINALRKKVKPYPVTLFGRNIFNIYGNLGPYSAYDRAQTAEHHIQQIYSQKIYVKDSLKSQINRDYIDILYAGKIITSIGEEDALWENASQDSLAKRYLSDIDAHIVSSRKDHALENLTSNWLTALGIIVTFFVLVFFINKLFRRLIKKLILWKTIDKSGLKIKNYQFLSPRKFRFLIIKILTWIRILIVLTLVYVALSIIFGIFPATIPWAYSLAHWIWEPMKEVGWSVYHYLPNLFRILLFLVIGRYANKLLRYFSIEIKRGNLKIRGFHTEWATPTYKLLRICLIAFTIIIVFPFLPGSDTSAFRGISVFFGVLISLGSSSAISNTIAGFIITYMRPFKEGDWIKINDEIGEVIEKSALVTRLRTINNEDVTVPNSMILTNKTTNYSFFFTRESAYCSYYS